MLRMRLPVSSSAARAAGSSIERSCRLMMLLISWRLFLVTVVDLADQQLVTLQQPALLPQRPAQLELGHDLVRQRPQREALVRVEVARAPVEHAQGTDGVPVGGLQQAAGVEAQAVVGRHQGIAAQALVAQRVRDDGQAGPQQEVAADRHVDRGFPHAQAKLGLEPLAAALDQVDHRDRHRADPGGEFDQGVEGGLARRVEHLVIVQGREPLGIVGRVRFLVHLCLAFPGGEIPARCRHLEAARLLCGDALL